MKFEGLEHGLDGVPDARYENDRDTMINYIKEPAPDCLGRENLALNTFQKNLLTDFF